MRRWLPWISILAALLVAGLVAGSVWAYTYEGELDPQVFFDWKWNAPIISPYLGLPFLQVIAQNPDQTSPIKVVKLTTLPLNPHSGYIIISYIYEKGGITYGYVFDPKQERYIQIFPKKEPKPTPEHKPTSRTSNIT